MALQASLGPLQREPGSDVIFHFDLQKNEVTNLAPSVVKRQYSATYATVPIALSDHTPREFKATNATDITLEFEVIAAAGKDVEATLSKLRKFIRKEKRTGEPPTLVLTLGKKSWVVRLDRIEVTPKLWNTETNESRVHVNLTLHTVEWEK